MIKDYLLQKQETGEMSEDDYAPESELPPDYQKSIDKDWYKPEDKEFKDTEFPVF